MSKTEATAEVFWTAFEALRPVEKQAFLRRLLQDVSLSQDLLDLATIESRKSEPTHPLRQHLERCRQRR